ncbi:MAG: ABC transporter substrate-binding protein [Defluviitaleaceae bacterium]|nr:ABC transporter substrate-binding protein [Defluviitaleaceae bacterium]
MRKNIILSLIVLTLVAFSGCGSSETQEADGSSNASNELTIAALHVDGFLETAAAKFEEMHEGRYKVTIVKTGDFTSYAQIINTALMSGMGEDIIMASHLAWQRLADAGRLVDLNGKIDLPPGTFYQNILDAYLYNSGRYVVPLSFNIWAFRLNEDVTTTINPNRFTLEDVIALAYAYPDLDLIHSPMGMSATILAHRIFELYFDEFIDLPNRTANVDNEKFINLLEDIQSIADKLTPTTWGIGTQVIAETIFHNMVHTIDGIVDTTGYNIITNSQGEGLVTARSHMAINANSQNQELAARFLQFLLSYDMQSSPEMLATPVNRNAAVTNSRALLESQRVAGFMPEGVDFDTNLTVFNSLADRLTIAETSDPFIGDFVRTEMTRFFDGEVTAEQAARNLQARLTTYLNE